MTTDRSDALGYHAAVSMVAGITGAALADRVVALVFAIVGSLAVVFVTELARPWLQRRARKLAGDSIRPPEAP
jgi:phage tail tape-measure protein